MFVLKKRKVRLMSVAFSPDGTKVATAGDRGAVHVWDLTTKELAADFSTGGNQIPYVAFLGPTRLAATIGADLHTRDLGGEGDWTRLPLSKTRDAAWPMVSPDRAAISRAGKTFARYTLAGPPALVWEKARPRAHWRLGPHAWSPCGRFLIEPNPDSTLTLRDAATGEAVGAFGEAGGPAVTRLAVSPGGHTAAWAASTNLYIQRAGGFLAHHRLGKTHFLGLAFHPSGGFLATANGDGKIDYWELASGGRRESLGWSSARLNDLAFDDTGDRGACCSNDGEVVIWDIDH